MAKCLSAQHSSISKNILICVHNINTPQPKSLAVGYGNLEKFKKHQILSKPCHFTAKINLTYVPNIDTTQHFCSLFLLKFMFSKKAKKIDEIFTVDLTLTTYVLSTCFFESAILIFFFQKKFFFCFLPHKNKSKFIS